ncbi:MAG: hypothetical protein AAF657_03885 [Acidobacteriota bacterium]
MKRLFYRPLEDLEDLHRLEIKVEGSRRRFRRFFRLAIGLATFFLFIELVAGGSGEQERPGCVMFLLLMVLIGTYAVRARYTRPRALAAQRLLFQHRGLLLDGRRPAGVIGEDITDSLQRLEARIAAQPASRSELAGTLVRTEQAFRSALQTLEDLQTQDRTDCEEAIDRQCAQLEAFRAAISRIEIDDLLQGSLAQDTVQALERSAQLLETPGP